MMRFPSTFTVRINCGSSASYTDMSGNVWEADSLNEFYENGKGSNGYVGETAENILDTDDDPLYQNFRYWRRSKPTPYRYRIPVPGSGDYSVTLFFAETDPTREIGKRIMNIFLENALVYPSFDIMAETGGALYTAVSLTSNVTVSDGALAIKFEEVIFNPMVSAIKIAYLG